MKTVCRSGSGKSLPSTVGLALSELANLEYLLLLLLLWIHVELLWSFKGVRFSNIIIFNKWM